MLLIIRRHVEGTDSELILLHGFIIHGDNSENRFVNFYLHVFVNDVKFLRSWLINTDSKGIITMEKLSLVSQYLKNWNYSLATIRLDLCVLGIFSS